MQWEVAGTHAVTGQARSIVVNADDAVQARRLGARRGWAVESVHPVDDAKAPPHRPAMVAVVAGVTVASDVQPVSSEVAPPSVVAQPAAEPTGRLAVAVGRRPIRDTRSMDRAAILVGVVGGAFVFAGVLLAAGAAPTSPSGGSMVARLAAGLPVVAAGVMQGVAALVIHVLAGVGAALRNLERDRADALATRVREPA